MIFASGPLSDPLPLRSTTAWPQYAAPALLPVVVGATPVTAIPYPLVAKRYILAGHALAGVDAVYVDGTAIAGWRWRNGVDVLNHAVAILDLAETVTGTVTAEVRGLSGNPGDILALLAPNADLREFTARTRNNGLTLGGAFREAMTRRAAIQMVVDQFGGGWSAGMPGFAAEFPPPAVDPQWATFGALERGGTQAQCELTNLVTDLTLTYDADAENQPRQALRLTASTAATYGIRSATVALPWVRIARLAEEIGTRYLQWRGRPLWTLQISIGPQPRMIPPGAWVTLKGSDLPVIGDAVVLDSDPDLGGGNAKLVVQIPAGTAPTITLTQPATAI
jgi:hypothetical protein